MAMLNNQMVKIKNWRAITTAMQSATTDAGYIACSCAADLRRWNFRVSVAFSRNLRELELQNAIVWVRSPAARVSCHQSGGAFRHLVLLPGLRECAECDPNNRHGGVPCTIHGHGTPVDKGVHFLPFSLGQAFPGHPRPNPLPHPNISPWCPVQDWTKDVHGKVRDERWGLVDWWSKQRVAASYCMCLKSIQMNGETSFIQHIYIYPLVK